MTHDEKKVIVANFSEDLMGLIKLGLMLNSKGSRMVEAEPIRGKCFGTDKRRKARIKLKKLADCFEVELPESRTARNDILGDAVSVLSSNDWIELVVENS